MLIHKFLIAALLFLGTSTAWAQNAFFDLVADSMTAFPGGFPGETFETFADDQPALVSSRCMAFVGDGSLDGGGLFLVRNGDIEIVADVNTPVPGGLPGELFDEFDAFSLDGCDVVFRASGLAGTIGIYRKREAEPLEGLVDVFSPAPVGTFTDLHEPWTHGGLVVFRAEHPGCGNGIFLYEGGEIDLIVDECGGVQVPGGQPGEIFTGLDTRPILEERAVTFRGVGNVVTTGIYRVDETGIETVADATTFVPGGAPGETFTGFQSYAPTSEGEVVFLGLGSAFSIGIYRESGGQLERLLDLAAAAFPGWLPGEILDLEEAEPLPWYSEGLLSLGVTGTMGSKGIYLLDEEGLHAFIAADDVVEERGILDVAPIAHLHGRRAAIAAHDPEGAVLFLGIWALFADSFESGDLIEWSDQVP